MSLRICVCTLILSLVPKVVSTIQTASDCPPFIQISPSFRTYEFNRNSELMNCSLNDNCGYTSRNGSWRLVLKNSDLDTVIASQEIQSGKGNITFQVQSIQSSTNFSCELLSSDDRVHFRAYAWVSVLINSSLTCTSNKDCRGYGRNVLCDTSNTLYRHRCMCAPKTRGASRSPICVELVTTEACSQHVCDENEADCVCARNDAWVLKQSKYEPVESLEGSNRKHDIIEIYGSFSQRKCLRWEKHECIHCIRLANGLRKLQIGLFLVGLVLAFTAVTLMAIVVRKMWLYYRISPELLEASRDLDRETVEREAERMAQRDKPPSYAEVMEYDLQVGGPPAYEELATAMRNLNHGRLQQAAESNTSPASESYQCVVEPGNTRGFSLNPWHRIAQSYMNTSPNRALPSREVAGSTESPRPLNLSRLRY